MKYEQHRSVMIVILLCCSLMVAWAAETKDNRYALVIGNSDYQEMTKLANPINDATDIATELTGFGFKVDLLTDASLGEMTRAVQRFVDNLQRSSEAEVALFYYAGHGAQFNGSNYLVPVNADIQASYELLDKTMGMDSVVRGLEQSKSDFNLIVLDACRDNPFSASRGGDRGLSVMGTGGRGSMVVFATSPGSVAQDGEGRNSPFTEAFLDTMRIPGVEIRQLITTVQRKVQDQTGGKQVPWVNMSYTGDFYFQTIEEQLARSQEELSALQEELAMLEQEIVQREAAIKTAGSVEERRRLEAEQATTKALEAAKQLEAQRAKELEEQAQEILDSQAAQDALRIEMDAQLASQAEELSLQAEQRKAELEALRAQQTDSDQSLQNRMETISKYNRSIQEIRDRYTQLSQSTIANLEILYKAKVTAFRNEHPRDPWETTSEHEMRLQEQLDMLLEAHETEKKEEEESLQNRLKQEIRPLLASRDEARHELQGMRFEVPIEHITVNLGKFNAENKYFPITVNVDDGFITFTQPLTYLIESRDREILKSEYYRVYSAAESDALMGKVAYRVFETKNGYWTVIPEYVKVLNLLENDAILSSAWEIGQNFVSTLPVGSFQVDTTVVKSPVDKLERNLFVTGLPKDAIVYVNGKIQQFLSDLILIGSVGNYSDFTVVIESPWVSKSLVIKNVIPLLPGYVAFCDVSSYVTSLGHLLIPRPDLSLKLQRIEEDEQYIPMELSSLGYFAKLAPGQYVVLGRLLGDSYDSFTSTLTVEAEKEIVFDPGPVGFSLKYRYEESLREQELLREELNKLAPMKTAGLSALGIATAGAVGTVVSYLLYSTAVQNYNDAIISSDLTRYRNDAALWSRVFTASLATGIAGGVTGGTVFAINAPETNRLSKRLEEQEILATELRNQIGAQNAREAMNAYTASSKVDFISLSEEDLFGKEAVLWFSLVGGTMDEPNQKNVTLGSRLGPLPIPKRSGYSFAGWWTDLGPNGIEVTPTTQVMKSDPFVMYAKWKDL